eukprot:scaffold77092_cov36-Phaeocystis_antarctica.AAC.2
MQLHILPSTFVRGERAGAVLWHQPQQLQRVELDEVVLRVVRLAGVVGKGRHRAPASPRRP